MKRKKDGIAIVTVATVIVILCISPLVFASYGTTPSTVSFGSRINLSKDTGASVEPYVAAGGSNVYAAWLDNSATGNYRVYFRASNNFGMSFNPLYVVSCPAKNQNCNTAVSKAGNIQIVAEGDNVVVLVWKQGKGIYESASLDAGVTWSAPVDVSASLNGSASSPVDAIAGSYVYISWVQSLSNGLSEIYVVNASNYGTSINSEPLQLSTGPTVSLHNEEDAIAASGSCVFAVWDSIWFTRSCDNGDAGTWNTPVQIKDKCCPNNLSREPLVVANGTNVYVTWTSNTDAPTFGIEGPYQAYVMVSNNDGDSFVDGTFHWFNLTGDFVTAREVQVSTWGSLVGVTYYGNSVSGQPVNQWISVSTNSGSSFSSPRELLDLTNGEPGFGGVLAYYSNVYVFWPHNIKGGVTQMYFEASADSGSTWALSNPSPISNGSSVGMKSNCGDVCDNGPMLAASGPHVYLVWEQIMSNGNSETMFSAS